jgi:hypothetical protein
VHSVIQTNLLAWVILTSSGLAFVESLPVDSAGFPYLDLWFCCCFKEMILNCLWQCFAGLHSLADFLLLFYLFSSGEQLTGSKRDLSILF